MYRLLTQGRWLALAVVIAPLTVAALFIGLWCSVAGPFAGAESPLVLAALVLLAAIAVDRFDSRQLQAAMGAELCGPEEMPHTRDLIEDVCLAAGMQTPALAIIHVGSPNACVLGKDQTRATLVVTDGLVSPTLTDEEKRAVIAHEVAHVLNGDLRWRAAPVAMASAVLYPIRLAAQPLARALAPLSEETRLTVLVGSVAAGLGLVLTQLVGREWYSETAIGLLMTLPVVLLVAILAWILAFSKLQEARDRLADVTAVRLTRNPESLISALQKADYTDIRRPWRELPLQHNLFFRPWPWSDDRVAHVAGVTEVPQDVEGSGQRVRAQLMRYESEIGEEGGIQR